MLMNVFQSWCTWDRNIKQRFEHDIPGFTMASVSNESTVYWHIETDNGQLTSHLITHTDFIFPIKHNYFQDKNDKKIFILKLIC